MWLLVNSNILDNLVSGMFETRSDFVGLMWFVDAFVFSRSVWLGLVIILGLGLVIIFPRFNSLIVNF
jgi:putative Mn2+ efflux pump MntP